jgi:uncharacterized protein YndB with AHSA1/START domain
MKKEITIVRTFDAPREKVWQAWTDPKRLAQWWSPRGFTTPVVELDPRVGGKLYIVMLGGEGMGAFSGMKAPMRGEFSEVVPNQKLAFSTNALDADGNVLLKGMTSVVFEDVSDPSTALGTSKTKMTVRTSAEGEGPNVEMMLGGMEQGWNEQADKLVEFLG